MVGVNPGKLRYRISVYRLLRVSNGSGGFTATEQLVYSTFAGVEQKRSVRADENGKMVIIKYYEILMRYSVEHPVEKDMLIKYKGQTLQISEITEVDEQKALISLIAVVS